MPKMSAPRACSKQACLVRMYAPNISADGFSVTNGTCIQGRPRLCLQTMLYSRCERGFRAGKSRQRRRRVFFRSGRGVRLAYDRIGAAGSVPAPAGRSVPSSDGARCPPSGTHLARGDPGPASGPDRGPTGDGNPLFRGSGLGSSPAGRRSGEREGGRAAPTTCFPRERGEMPPERMASRPTRQFLRALRAGFQMRSPRSAESARPRACVECVALPAFAPRALRGSNPRPRRGFAARATCSDGRPRRSNSRTEKTAAFAISTRLPRRLSKELGDCRC